MESFTAFRRSESGRPWNCTFLAGAEMAGSQILGQSQSDQVVWYDCQTRKTVETVNHLQVSPVASIYWMTPTGCWWMKSTVSNETLESCVFALYNPFHFSMLNSWQFSTVHLESGLPPDSAAFAEGDLQEPGRWAVRHAMRHAFVKARRRW